jgi:hypothetical protein
VTVWPWIVTVPVRELVDGLAVTLNMAVPLPEPLPTVIVNQLASLVALQPQPPLVVTVALPMPPAALIERVVGETV